MEIKLDADTAEEHEKFVEDAARLAEDISGNQTFSTVKPLLNFWAAFSASREVIIFLIMLSKFNLMSSS